MIGIYSCVVCVQLSFPERTDFERSFVKSENRARVDVERVSEMTLGELVWYILRAYMSHQHPLTLTNSLCPVR